MFCLTGSRVSGAAQLSQQCRADLARLHTAESLPICPESLETPHSQVLSRCCSLNLLHLLRPQCLGTWLYVCQVRPMGRITTAFFKKHYLFHWQCFWSLWARPWLYPFNYLCDDKQDLILRVLNQSTSNTMKSSNWVSLQSHQKLDLRAHVHKSTLVLTRLPQQKSFSSLSFLNTYPPFQFSSAPLLHCTEPLLLVLNPKAPPQPNITRSD